MDELIDKILSHEIHEAEKKFPDELEKLGWELFGLKPCGCGNRLIEIFLKLHRYKKTITMEVKNRKAELKEGVVLRVPQLGVTWTNGSPDFTDKKACEVLKKYEKLSSRFKTLPEGYKTPEEKAAAAKVRKTKKATTKATEQPKETPATEPKKAE